MSALTQPSCTIRAAAATRRRAPWPAVLVALLVTCPPALADTVHVDGSNPGCPGTGTLVDPFCSIQDAVDAALPGDTVLVAAGTYAELLDFGGKAIALRSADGPATTIVAPTFPLEGSVVSFANGEGPGSVLEGFTLRGGDGTVVNVLPGFDETAGGGVFCDGSSPRILGNVIENNSATFGGGVFCDGASPLIRGNTIRSNSGEIGAGIHCRNGAAPTISLNTISDHLFVSCCGAGISIESGSAPIIDGNEISGNSASTGAGISIEDSTATITHNLIANNFTDEDLGGGISCFTSDPVITDNVFDSNNAQAEGGAIGCGLSSAFIARNEFTNNRGDLGGGYGTFIGSADLLDGNTFIDNTADFVGSAIAMSGTVEARRNTVRGGNPTSAIRASSGLIADCLVLDSGGVELEGTARMLRTTVSGSFFAGVAILNGSPSVESCILWGNGGLSDIFLLAGTPSVTWSDVGGGFAGTGNIDVDPLFTDPVGGNYSLLTGSPCIDAGDPADLVCDVDLLGAPRRLDGLLDVGSQVDMGAIEFSNIELLATAPAMAGDPLGIDTDGTAGLSTWIFAAAVPDTLCLPKYGTFLFDLGTPFVLASVGANPVSFVASPPEASGITLILQAVGVAPGGLTANTSNAEYVLLP